jgi:hypothetical protein
LPEPETAREPGEGLVRSVTWKVLSLFFAMAAGVVFAADFAFSREVTWSIVPLASMGFLWLSGSAIIFLSRRVQIVLVLETLSLLLFLAVLDRVTPGRSWFLFPAAPLTALLGLVVSLVVFLARRFDLSALSIVALSLTGAGAMLLAVESTLNYFYARQFFVSWSLLSVACSLPPALLLFYLQRQLRKSGPEIRKRFHL